VSHLSVAVVVDDKKVPSEDGSGLTAQSRTAEEMERLRSIVRASVGLNLERGDTLTVENISFTTPVDEKVTFPAPSFWERNKEIIYPVARYFLIILLFVLFYLMVFRPVKKRVFAYVEVENPTAARLNASLKDPELMKQLEQALSGEKLLESGEGGHQILDKDSAMKKELVRLAKENPQAVTHLIRSWLSEGV
jgi:flagellar M-ring protein FliF